MIFKTIVEDTPIIAMQALYLAFNICGNGLNSILILSLYFNCVCILYALSNCCSNRTKDNGKVYQKEMERLKEYYDETSVRVIAEFYIED